jgi:hypothetical protein
VFTAIIIIIIIIIIAEEVQPEISGSVGRIRCINVESLNISRCCWRYGSDTVLNVRDFTAFTARRSCSERIKKSTAFVVEISCFFFGQWCRKFLHGRVKGWFR